MLVSGLGPGIGKLNDDRRGDRVAQVVGEDEARVAADESEVGQTLRRGFAGGRGQTGAVDLDPEEAVIRHRAGEVDEVVSHPESDLDDQWPLDLIEGIQIDHLTVVKPNSESI